MTSYRPLFFALLASLYLLISYPLAWLLVVLLLTLLLAALLFVMFFIEEKWP